MGADRQPETQLSPPGLSQADLFVSGEDGYHTYRIPALTVTRQGSLLAFCEGRKNNRRDHGDIDLLVKRSTDGGRTWSGQQIVYEEGGTEEITIGNPCPVVDRETGTIWLPFCRDNKDVLVTKSIDDGVSWSDPVDITADVKNPEWSWVATGPGVGIQLDHGPHKGRLLIPSDHGEGSGEEGDERVQYSHVFYSDDHGETWQLGGTVAPHTDECQVIQTDDGTPPDQHAQLLGAARRQARPRRHAGSGDKPRRRDKLVRTLLRPDPHRADLPSQPDTPCGTRRL